MAPLRAALALACAVTTTLADFTTSFDDVTHGHRLEVSWDKLGSGDTPAYISGRIFNTTEDGVVSFQANISTSLTGTSFTWINVPYPLPYIPTAQYELELLPENPSPSEDEGSNSQSKSDLFYIRHSSDEDEVNKRPTVASGPLATPEPPKSRGGPGTPIIIVAVCVGLGIPILIGIGVWIWCMRKEKQRKKYEENRRLRYQTIID